MLSERVLVDLQVVSMDLVYCSSKISVCIGRGNITSQNLDIRSLLLAGNLYLGEFDSHKSHVLTVADNDQTIQCPRLYAQSGATGDFDWQRLISQK